MVDAFRTQSSYLWMHHFQENFGGRPPWFGDLEIGSYDLVTISNSHFFLHAFIDVFEHVMFSMFIMLNVMFIKIAIYIYSI